MNRCGRFKIQIDAHKTRQGLPRCPCVAPHFAEILWCKKRARARARAFEVRRYSSPARDLSEDASDKNRRGARRKYLPAPLVYRYAATSKELAAFLYANPDRRAFADICDSHAG